MTDYELNIMSAKENDKIIYYDYLQYKKAAGWWTGANNTDWNRPTKIKKARYNSSFLLTLPNYYFLGFPIKELIKSSYSNGHCYACAFALSLFFDDFQIVTCNLKSYADYCNQKSPYKVDDYEHAFLTVNLDGKKVIIDTTFGFITDLETYNSIFNIDKVRIMFAEDIKNTNIYKYIQSRKLFEGPSKQSQIDEVHQKVIFEYMNLCKLYKNEYDKYLEEFFNTDLLNNSDDKCFEEWIKNLELNSLDSRFNYPDKDMFSLEDDEYDKTLYSKDRETSERNRRVLESYHEVPKEKTKNKILKIFNKLLKQ